MTAMGIVFPGQGSQTVGMLDIFAQHFPEVKQTLDEASTVLDYSLWQLITSGPAERLNETEFTQVAMLASDVAMYRVLQARHDFQPVMMAGHSLGEYAALVCGGALDFLSAVTLVRKRGQLMQQYVGKGEGAMAAIVGLEDAQVEQLCQQATLPHSRVMPANYNAIGQVVVAGHHAAVERLLPLAERAGARLAKMIPVSVPCHCDLLSDASLEFGSLLQQTHFEMGICPIISNVDAQPYASTQAMQVLLAKQLYSPVRWVQSVQFMRQQGVDQLIESGPGQVLAGLIKRIDRTLPVSNVLDRLSH